MFNELILLRLIAAPPEGETLSNIKKDLQPLTDAALSGEAFQARFDELTRLVLIARGRGRNRYTLTPEGQKAARERFHLPAELPANTRWVQLRDRYLTAIALGIQEDASAMSQIGTAPGLRVAILRKEHAPDLRNFPTLPQLVDQLVAKAVGARRNTLGEFRNAVIKNWLGGKGTGKIPRVEKPVGETLHEKPVDVFAHEIQRLAAQTSSGRFGDHKVFVSHVWKEAQAQGIPGLATDYDHFKARLIEANTKGLLSLSRADLIGALPREDVEASETSDALSSFHFIQI